MREIPARADTHLGDEEREDLIEIATIATLEIAPVHASEGWRLSVVLEDELGLRISNGGTSEGNNRSIDFGTFYKEFIRPERGNATVIAESENSAGKAHLTRLINAIESNRHGPNRGSSRRQAKRRPPAQ